MALIAPATVCGLDMSNICSHFLKRHPLVEDRCGVPGFCSYVTAFL